MSHAATAWALTVTGIKPVDRMVLWYLCDRYHPDHGCHPVISVIADECRLSRTSIVRHIDVLIRHGIVERQEHSNPVTGRPEKPSYTFPPKPWEAGEQRPDPIVADPVLRETYEQTKARYFARPAAPPQLVDADPMPPMPPMLADPPPAVDPVAITEDDDPLYLELARGWPVKERLAEAWDEWCALGRMEQPQAASYAASFLADATSSKGRRATEPLASYLRGRPWRYHVNVKILSIAAATRPWWAVFWRKVDAGDRVGWMVAQCERGVAWPVRSEDLPSDDDEVRLISITIKSKAYELWKRWCLERGFHLPYLTDVPVIYVPSEWPPGVDLVDRAEAVASELREEIEIEIEAAYDAGEDVYAEDA